MRERFYDVLNELCQAYHSDDFRKTTDVPAMSLLFSLIGVAPLEMIPIKLQSSLNCFREINHQERYSFVMGEIAKLMDNPSENKSLRDYFIRLSSFVEPVTDSTGVAVLAKGVINFGSYKDTYLSPLIFRV